MLRIAGLLGCLLLLTIGLGVSSALAVNKALSLDGDGDYVNVRYAPILDYIGDFTLESWICLSNNPDDGNFKPIISKHTSEGAYNGYAEYDLQVQGSGHLNFFMGDGFSYGINLNGGILNSVLWYHVAITFNGTSGVMYLNGNPVDTDTFSGMRQYGTLPVQIGRYNDNSPGIQYFNGLIDEVRIWKVARTQKEIQSTMNRRLIGNEPGLVGYWNFDDSTVNDLTEFDNDSKLQGDAHFVESDLPLGPGPPIIKSVAPNYGSVSGGTQVLVKGYDFQEYTTVNIDGNELIDMTIFPEVTAYVKSKSIDITDVAPDDVTLSITLKERFTPEVVWTLTFPTDSTIVPNIPVLKKFIETTISDSPELAGKIIVSVDGTNSDVTITFTTVDKGTGVQLSIEQTSGSDILFSTVVSDEGRSEIIGTTSPGALGLHDVVVTNPDGGSDILVRGFSYMPDCELPPDVTTNTLSITGTVYKDTGKIAENGLSVEVKIITQNLTEVDATGETAGDGQYSVTFFDAEKPVAKEGDEVLVTVKGDDGKLVGQSRYTLTSTEVETKATIIDVIPDVSKIQFTLKLSIGINLVSIPIKLEGSASQNPDNRSWRMSNLAKYIGKENLSMIIWYDDKKDIFVSYMPHFPDDSPANAPLECGSGYIIVMKVEKELIFEGNPCENEIAAPSLMPLMSSSDNRRTSIFVVTGNVSQYKTDESLDDVSVMIRNLRTGQIVYDVTGRLAGNGSYVGTFVASSEEFMTHTGDKLEITAIDKDNRFTMTPVTYTLITRDISDYVLVMPLHLSLPKKSTLLPNYPNPFNPETWIPFQLATDTSVIVSIYNANGQLIHTISLGNKSAGVYTTKDRAAYWDGKGNLGEKVSSGVYFYTLQAGDFTATRKMVILK